MTSLPLSLSPMTPHPHRCCCCYPLWDTMLQSEHPFSVSPPSGTEYDCMPRCHILSCAPWCVCRSACSISSSDARSPAFSTPATWCRVVHSRVFSAPVRKSRCIAPFPCDSTALLRSRLAPPESRRSKEAPNGAIFSIENSSGLRSDVRCSRPIVPSSSYLNFN